MANQNKETKKPIPEKLLKEAKKWMNDDLEAFNAEYKQLCERDHSFAGRLVKCHLLLEYYLTEYLEAAYPTIPNISDARLTFSQKLNLATYKKTNFFQFIDAIQCLNTLRNKLVHDIRYVPNKNDLNPIRSIMKIWNSAFGKPMKDGIELIEEMTIFVCGMFSGLTQHIRRGHQNDGIIGCLEWFSEVFANHEDWE